MRTPIGMRRCNAVLTRAIGALLFAAVPLAPAYAQPGDLPPLATIAGRILDSEGRPVPFAEVSASTAPHGIFRAQVRTDADGAYSLPVWGGAHYWVELEGGHYRSDATPNRHEIYLVPGEARLDADFRLDRPAGMSIAGVVVGPDGEPAAGASLSGKTSGGAYRYAQTDELGRFRLTDIAAGEDIRFQAHKVGMGRAESGLIAAGAGEVVMRLVPPPVIRGRVVDANGDPVRRYEIYPDTPGIGFHAPQPDSWIEVAHPDGRFEITALDEYKVGVMVRAPGFAPQAVKRRLSSAVEFVELVVWLEPERTVTGRVTTPDGTPFAGAKITIPADGQTGYPVQGASAVTGEDGRYALGGLTEGEFVLVAGTPGMTPWAQSAKLDGAVLETTLDWTFTPGGSITLRLSNGGEPSEGHVYLRNRRISPANEQMFRMITRSTGGIGGGAAPLSAPIPYYRSTRGIGGNDSLLPTLDPSYFQIDRPAPDGRFVSAGLAPGTYVLEIRRTAAPNEAYSPLNALHMPGMGDGSIELTIDIGENEQVVRDIDLSEPNAIAGVVHHNGQPVAAEKIAVNVTSDGTRIHYVSQTDQAGRFVFDRLANGIARLQINYRDPDYRLTSIARSFHLEGGDARSLDLDFTRMGFVCGDWLTDGRRYSKVLVIDTGAEAAIGEPFSDRRAVVRAYEPSNTGDGPRLLVHAPLPGVDSGHYRLIAVDAADVVVAGPVDIEVRPGEITRVEF